MACMQRGVQRRSTRVRLVGSRTACVALIVALAWLGAASARASSAPQMAVAHARLNEILDLYVRDGQVYYRALQLERATLDRYIAALDVPTRTYDAWAKPERLAYWLNAYNAFVLRTVIDHYPIRGTASEYPTISIRQIPGAFETRTHRAAGRAITLDEIETTVLPAFGDPRVFLALGRGAVGSARLRSEAFVGARLEAQLAAAAQEFATRARLLDVDEVANIIRVSPILGWREADFVAVYADPGGSTNGRYASRSPIERAILHFVEPNLLPMERTMVERNDFTITFSSFDWRLNDLTGGRID